MTGLAVLAMLPFLALAAWAIWHVITHAGWENIAMFLVLVVAPALAVAGIVCLFAWGLSTLMGWS